MLCGLFVMTSLKVGSEEARELPSHSRLSCKTFMSTGKKLAFARIPADRCTKGYLVSVTARTALAGMFRVTICFRPEGQSTSTLSTLGESPKPK